MAHNDFDHLGRDLQELIEKAVDTRNYQQLSQSITQVLNQAFEAGNKGMKTVMNVLQEETGTNTKTVTKTTVQKTEIHNTHREQNQQIKTVRIKANPALYKGMTGNKVLGLLEIAGGGLLTLMMGGGLIASSVAHSLVNSSGTISSILMGIGMLAGMGLAGAGAGLIARVDRFQQYVKILGEKTYGEFSSLAKRIGKSVKFVKKDIKKMIAKGWFAEGHVDAAETCVITSDEMYEQYRQIQKENEERLEREKPTINVDGSYSKEVQEVLDKGNAFLIKIRKSNEAIPGEVISRKISRMEMLVQKIFERAKEHPEIIPDLKKLMNYYLPMTVKLLDAYEDMDHQTIQGENITNSKAEIENTLDTLNSAFEKLLDSVYKDTALDVSSDITVLQTLLAQEGLTEDEIHNSKNRGLQMPSN